jgi:hypothetical protein
MRARLQRDIRRGLDRAERRLDHARSARARRTRLASRGPSLQRAGHGRRRCGLLPARADVDHGGETISAVNTAGNRATRSRSRRAPATARCARPSTTTRRRQRGNKLGGTGDGQRLLHHRRHHRHRQDRATVTINQARPG